MRASRAPSGRSVLWFLVVLWLLSSAAAIASDLRRHAEFQAGSGAGVPAALQELEPETPPEPPRGIRPPWRDPLVPEMKRYKVRKDKALTA